MISLSINGAVQACKSGDICAVCVQVDNLSHISG